MTTTTQWQPIETAAKDDSTILAWGKFRRDGVTVIWDAEVGKWRSNVYAFVAFEAGQLTHWQPVFPPMVPA